MELVASSYPYVPLWLLALLLLAGLLLAREFGHWVRTRWPLAANGADEAPFATTSILGLLALLIGFTFSIALARYDARRDLVVQEANAIGAHWAYLDLLDPADGARVRAVVRRYVDARIDFGQARTAAEEVQQNQRSAALQAELWSGVVAAVAPFRDSPRAVLLLDATNDVIDLAGQRYASRQSHIPPRILRLLLVFALLAAVMVGYERGAQRRSTTLLFLLLTLAMSLVIDLDRPSTGLTNVPQQPMYDVQAAIGGGAAVDGNGAAR